MYVILLVGSARITMVRIPSVMACWLLGAMATAVAVGAVETGAGRPNVHGGMRYVTTHSFAEPVASEQIVDTEVHGICEYHFHVYFHLPGKDVPYEWDAYNMAMQLRQNLLAEVRAGKLVAVFHGVNRSIFPALNVSAVPGINMQPTGPHPAGSFEVWVPQEHLSQALSFFMLNRQELSVLLHPLTRHAIEDHTGRSMWLGEPFRLNLNVLIVDGFATGGDGPQYPELKMGCSAPSIQY